MVAIPCLRTWNGHLACWQTGDETTTTVGWAIEMYADTGSLPGTSNQTSGGPLAVA